MGLEVSIGGAFLAGLLSFLSPCVLPLVPPCYITGYTLDDLADRKDEARVNSVEVVIAALLFVAGFSAVFVAMGATASAIGQVLRDHMALLAKLSGVVIILMGLHFLGVFRIGLLSASAISARGAPGQSRRRLRHRARFRLRLDSLYRTDPRRHPGDCRQHGQRGAGDRIAGDLFRRARRALRCGTLFLGQFLKFLRRFRQHVPKVERVMGLLLVATGIMFLTGSIQTLSYWFLELFPEFRNARLSTTGSP